MLGTGKEKIHYLPETGMSVRHNPVMGTERHQMSLKGKTGLQWQWCHNPDRYEMDMTDVRGHMPKGTAKI